MSTRDAYRHTITNTFSARQAVSAEVPADALSAPTSDDLVSAGLMFWPSGAAWGAPDGDAVSLTSVLTRFTRVLLSPFEWLYARAWRLALESSAQTVTETLDLWEQEYGLPEHCFPPDQSTAMRLAILRSKVSAEPLSHPEDFVRVASGFGFEIEIEEPCIVECGYSECGGRHETGAAQEEAFAIVRVRDAAAGYFECATSESGFDRLYDLGGAEQIVCFLRQELPGWVVVIPDEWVTYGHWVTETGAHVTDEYGNRILFRI
ncbi:hypothetical protein [Shinella zoogloeoides]|uniref:hypothetical protein n=1 Tax=Shinella zoogloeoides TaxID=352475 RepID=UPI0028AB2DAA|nr:hypothetical protein [Shinella zoogloeoides]